MKISTIKNKIINIFYVNKKKYKNKKNNNTND